MPDSYFSLLLTQHKCELYNIAVVLSLVRSHLCVLYFDFAARLLGLLRPKAITDALSFVNRSHVTIKEAPLAAGRPVREEILAERKNLSQGLLT